MRESHTTLIEQFRLAPKIDLHRHLLGSIRLTTLWEFARKYDLDAGRQPIDALRHQVVRSSPALDLADYIRPWAIFREVIHTPEDVYRVAREAAEDARVDGVVYVEFRSSLPGMPLTDGHAPQTRIPAFDYLGAIRDAFADSPGIVCRLVASIPRHVVGRASRGEILHYTGKFLSVVASYRDVVVGVDLTGIERGWPASLFLDFFNAARADGLPATIHAGETEGPDAIWAAIDDLAATRIGHGTSAVCDTELVRELIRRDIVLEVCPTAAWLTGRTKDRRRHPVIECELPIRYSICTDNPTLDASILSQELLLAARGADPERFCREQLGLAARAAFAPEAVPLKQMNIH